MTMPISGNATVINVLLRWPVLSTIVAVAGVGGVVADKVLEPIPQVAMTETLPPIEFDPPAAGPLLKINAKPELKKADDLCPSVAGKKTMSKKKQQQAELEKLGCKIKG